MTHIYILHKLDKLKLLVNLYTLIKGFNFQKYARIRQIKLVLRLLNLEKASFKSLILEKAK